MKKSHKIKLKNQKKISIDSMKLSKNDNFTIMLSYMEKVLNYRVCYYPVGVLAKKENEREKEKRKSEQKLKICIYSKVSDSSLQ